MDTRTRIESLLCEEALPTVWCPGCGIGTVLFAILEAIKHKSLNEAQIRLVSGIGCAGKVAEVIKLKTHSFNDGYVIKHALRIKKNHPDSFVLAVLNNPDFLLSGARDFHEACAAGARLIVVYLNNFIYAASKDRVRPITPFMRKSFDGKHDLPFNIPYLADTCGAAYIARWTPLRAGWLKYAFVDAFDRKGFSVIEVVSPCLIYNANSGRIQDTIERMVFYNDNTEISMGKSLEALDLRKQKKIIVGKFVDRELDRNRAE